MTELRQFCDSLPQNTNNFQISIKLAAIKMKQEKRNSHAFHPTMKKSGAHEKSEKAKRKATKHEVNRKVHEWLGT